MISKLREEINKHFVGKDNVVENVLICLLAGGHVLLEDVPGVGKTTLAKTIAQITDMSFARISFTPDTLPSDILGVSVYNAKTCDFEYNEGVIMNQIVLADELNRTSPKTQAALLEAMAEGQITVDKKSYKLPDPFFVIATQNPTEFLGTYPLPEAQKDRFMMRLSIGYPSKEEEIKMALGKILGKGEESFQNICGVEDICKMKEEVKAVAVKEAIVAYVEDIITATRNSSDFVLGASPRAMLALISASQAKAYIEGRDYVIPDDVKFCAINVLVHRMTLTSEAKLRKESIGKIVEKIVVSTKVPMD